MANEISISIASGFLAPSKVARPEEVRSGANSVPPTEAVKQGIADTVKGQRGYLEEVGQKPQPLSKEELSDAAKQLNELTQSIRRELQFALDEDSGRTVISVIDAESGAMIRQIPPEEIVTMITHLKEYKAGLFQEQA